MIRQIPADNANLTAANGADAAVAAYLNDRFGDKSRPLGRIDRWTQQSTTVHCRQKLTRILRSANPAAQGYAALVGDIEREARHGIFLATPAGHAAQLQRLAGESGMSGRLFQHLPTIAPLVYPEALAHAGGKPEILCTAIEARYDRANLNAEVSELILMHLLDNEDDAADIADELRVTLYTYHEDLVRRRCDLPGLLSPQAAQRSTKSVRGLLERARRFNEALAE